MNSIVTDWLNNSSDKNKYIVLRNHGSVEYKCKKCYQIFAKKDNRGDILIEKYHVAHLIK